MTKINYTCDKAWGDMISIDSENKICTTCKLNVRDYSKNKKVEIDSQCGRFNISQIQSFNRNYQLSSSKAITISLIALLGLTAISQNVEAQTTQVNNEISNAVNDSEYIEIKGTLLDKESKNPLCYGTVQVYNDFSLVGIAMTNQRGEFLMKIDTVKYSLNNLKVTFNNEQEITTDTVSLNNQNYNKIAVELEVNTNWINSLEYIITGDIDIDDSHKQPQRKD